MQQEINLTALFGAYSKSFVITKNKGNDLNRIGALYLRYLSLYEKDEILESFYFSECKLALKPLSTITNEHLRMIAKIAFENGKHKANNLDRIDRTDPTGARVYFKGFEASFVLAFKKGRIWFQKENNPLHSVLNALEIYDTLRLLGYDCGYMQIPSLIEDGRYAVDITKLQTK